MTAVVADDVLARMSVPEERAQAMRQVAIEMVDFFDQLVARGGTLERRHLYNREHTWRKHHPDVKHSSLRQLMLVVHEVVVPADYKGIDVPGPLTDYHPTPSPLNSSCQGDAAVADRLEKCYVAWRLNLPPAELTPDLAAAEILFLCATRGGLVMEPTLEALAHMPLKTLICDDVPQGNDSADLPWIVPPPEATLALRAFHARYRDRETLLTGKQGLADALNSLLAKLDENISLEKFLDAAKMRVRRDAPDWLVALILGKVTDTPLLPCARARVMSGLPLLVHEHLKEVKERKEEMTLTSGSWSADLPAAPAVSNVFLAELQKDLKAKRSNRASIIDAVDRRRDAAPDPLCGLLASLAKHYLDTYKARPRSVARYLSALRHVPHAAGLQMPFVCNEDGTWQADPQSWENILLAAADPRLSSDKQTPQQLFRLHRFATQHLPILEECDLEDIEDLNFPRRARAIVVTDEEVARAVDRVKVTKPAETGSCLLGEIAYASACRLRELTHARLSDLRIFPDGRLILEIRAHADRSLKRTSSRRDIPLHELLSADQRQRLHAHAQTLTALGRRPTKTYLFATLDRAQAPPSRDQCYQLVIALREVTGDPNITFHSLRHSAANWLMLQMLCWEIPGLGSLPLQGLDPERFKPSRVASLVLTLCPDAALAPPNRLPATWTQSLARLLGHSSPLTGLHYYLHLRPLYQAWVLARDLKELPTELIALLADLPERTQRRQIKQWREAASTEMRKNVTRAQVLWLIHWEITHANDLQRRVHQATPPQIGLRVPSRGWLRIAAVPIVGRLILSGVPAQQIAEVMGCADESVQRICGALSPSVKDAYRAPALRVPSLPRRKKDHVEFIKLAHALDRHKPSPDEHDALSRLLAAEKRWVLASDQDCVTVLGFLFRVLPDDAVVFVELQQIDGHKVGSPTTQREDRWRQLIANRWDDRLRVIAHPPNTGPSWRYRPEPRGPGLRLEWAHLRIGKLPWPERSLGFERCPGYTVALQCLRVAYDLRTPMWRAPRERSMPAVPDMNDSVQEWFFVTWEAHRHVFTWTRSTKTPSASP
jgi:integrase